MSLSFNTTSSRVIAGNDIALQNLEPITICAWIYPTGWGGLDYGRVTDKGDSNVFFITDYGTTSGIGTLGVEALAFYRARTGDPTDFRSNDNSIVLNTWQHVAVSSTSTGTTLYINGEPVSSYVSNSVGTGTILDDSTEDLLVGNRADLARFFEGQQSDVRVYNIALDDDAIRTIYSSFGVDSILDGLVLRYPFMDKAPGSSFSSVVDVSINKFDGNPVDVSYEEDNLSYRRRT